MNLRIVISGILSIAIIAMSDSAYAFICPPCEQGNHMQHSSPDVTSVQDPVWTITARSSGGCNDPGEHSPLAAVCSSNISSQNKYTLSGSLTWSYWGISGSDENTKASGSDCSTSGNSTVGSCLCAYGKCGYNSRVETDTLNLCVPHQWCVLPFIYVTCDCTYKGSVSGTLSTVEGPQCQFTTDTNPKCGG